MPFIAPQALYERFVFAFPLALCFVHSSSPPSLPAPSPLPAYDQREHATESQRDKDREISIANAVTGFRSCLLHKVLPKGLMRCVLQRLKPNPSLFPLPAPTDETSIKCADGNCQSKHVPKEPPVGSPVTEDSPNELIAVPMKREVLDAASAVFGWMGLSLACQSNDLLISGLIQ
jgi:hypothetical protein